MNMERIAIWLVVLGFLGEGAVWLAMLCGVKNNGLLYVLTVVALVAIVVGALVWLFFAGSKPFNISTVETDSDRGTDTSDN